MLKTTKKLNILVSCGSYSWGGLEMAALESTVKLREYGFDVSLLCSKGSRLKDEAERLGIETLPYFSTDLKIPFTILKLKKFLENSDVDIIHSHHSHDLWTLTPAISAAHSKIKLFLTKHVASGVKKDDYFHKKIYGRLNGIFAISGYIKTSVLNTTALNEDKVHVIPNGVNLKQFNREHYSRNEILQDLNIPDEKLIIGLVGRITPGKGHIELIGAAGILNERFPGKLYFLLVGSSGKGEEEYEKEIRSLAEGLNNLKFAGQTDEPGKFFAAMDILAFPSHDESFGRVVIEAMAMDVPVAASGYAGVLDIITDGKTGLLFQPKSSISLAEALEKLITDEKMRKELAAFGKMLVQEKFTDDIVTDILIKHYQK